MSAEPAFAPESDGHIPSANPFFRKAILAATNQSLVSGTVRKYGMRLGTARFVAGETFDECIPVLRGLNQQGFRTNTTLLGEGVSDEATADWVVGEYKKFATSFTTIHAEDIRAQVEAIYAQGRFWPDPLIQINPRYKRGADLDAWTEAFVQALGTHSDF